MGELVGPWLFGVAMFTVLILASTVLFKASGYLVQGVPFPTVIEFLLLVVPGVLVKTFAMAMLLAALLAFGRLSGDSEIVALRAAGANLVRIIAPVGGLALAIALLTLLVDETLVPWSSKRLVTLSTAISDKLDPTALGITYQPIVSRGKTVGVVIAQGFDQVNRVLIGATVIGYGPNHNNTAYLYAKRLKFDPAELTGWHIEGGADLVSADGMRFTHITDAWPNDIPRPTFSPEDIISSQINNPDVMSMAEIRARIQTVRTDPNHAPDKLNDLQYQYWNKIALPLAVVVYGILGAPLGIRRNRASAGAGFALAVVIIFGHLTLANFLNVYAMGGVIPPWVASFTPVGLGMIAAAVLVRLRNG